MLVLCDEASTRRARRKTRRTDCFVECGVTLRADHADLASEMRLSQPRRLLMLLGNERMLSLNCSRVMRPLVSSLLCSRSRKSLVRRATFCWCANLTIFAPPSPPRRLPCRTPLRAAFRAPKESADRLGRPFVPHVAIGREWTLADRQDIKPRDVVSDCFVLNPMRRSVAQKTLGDQNKPASCSSNQLPLVLYNLRSGADPEPRREISYRKRCFFAGLSFAVMRGPELDSCRTRSITASFEQPPRGPPARAHSPTSLLTDATGED